MNGGPIQTEEQPTDFSGFTLDELLLFAMHKKSRGIANWDESLVQAVESAKMYPGKEPPFFAPLLQAG